MRHRIFVGSSTEDLTLANAIQLNLSRQGHTVKVWDQGVFAVGKNILEGLIHAPDVRRGCIRLRAQRSREHPWPALRRGV